MNSRRERWLRQAVGEANAAKTLEELAAAATPPLARALAAGVVLFGRFDAVGLTVVGGFGAPMLDEYQRDGYALDDPHVAAARRVNRPIMIASRMVAPAELHATRSYQRFWSGRLGVEDSIYLQLTAEGFGRPGCLGYRFWRGKRQPAYSVAEGRWLGGALGAFRRAARRCTGGELPAVAIAALDVLAGSRLLLAVGLDGHVFWAAPRAAELVRPLLARRCRWPEPVQNALDGWRARPEARAKEPVRVALWTPATGDVELELRLVAPKDGARFALVELMPESVANLAELSDRFGLGPAERRVLGLMASGLANKAIAGRLGISPATVRTHAYNLFRKLDVGSRVEALVLLRDLR